MYVHVLVTITTVCIVYYNCLINIMSVSRQTGSAITGYCIEILSVVWPSNIARAWSKLGQALPLVMATGMWNYW